MSERAAFIRAICEQPGDDTSRLVFADWLDENGQPERAELIRVQIELERDYSYLLPAIPVKDSDRRLDVLLRRDRELLATDAVWLSAFDCRAGRFVERKQAQFGRGFVTTVKCSWVCWEVAADDWHWHPSQGRPCPETAQPVTWVALTTRPEFEGFERWWAEGLGGQRRQCVRATVAGKLIEISPISEGDDPTYHLLERRFPGIEFELPSEPERPGRIATSTFTIPEPRRMIRGTA